MGQIKIKAPLTAERLPEMAEAINQRVASHIGAFSDHLKRNRKPAANGAICLTGVIHA